MIFLPREIARIADFAAETNPRFATTHIRVRRQGPNGWRMDATNGRILVVARGDSQPGKLDLGQLDPSLAVQTFALECLVHPKDLAEAFKILPKDEGERRHVGLALGQRYSTLATGAAFITSEASDKPFPDTDSAFPRAPAMLTISLHPDALARIARLAQAVCDDDKQSAHILYYGKDKPLGMIIDGPEGLGLDVLVMPQTP